MAGLKELSGGGLASVVYISNANEIGGGGVEVSLDTYTYTGPFTIPTGAYSVYIQNNGVADIDFNDISLSSGQFLNISVDPPNYLSELSGDATGSSALVIVGS